MHRLALAVAIAAFSSLAIGCGSEERSPSDIASAPADLGARAWQRLPGAPLSPREGALGIWTGREALIIGGSDARPCPPNARCPAPDVPRLRDGAAFDPEARRWRRIASSPVSLALAESVVVGGIAYVWTSDDAGTAGNDAAFIEYSRRTDRWRRLPLPPGGAEGMRGLTRAGDRIVAYATTDGAGDRADLAFDPAVERWSELPRDPLPPSSGRVMVWSGHELVLFAHQTVADASSADQPALTQAAALDAKSGVWRRLPDSEILGLSPWVPVDGLLINPMLGSADGGKVNGWGRSYPNGGILDVSRSRWLPLPDSPREEADMAAGVVTPSRGHYFSDRGWVLDTTTSTWTELPSIDDEKAFVTGRTVVAARSRLLVFGGVRWSNGNRRGELRDAASIW